MLKRQSFGHLMWGTDSLQKTLMVGKIEGRKRRGWKMMRWFGWHHWLNDMSLSKLRELVMDREARHAAVHGVTKSPTWLINWTQLMRLILFHVWQSSGLFKLCVHAVTSVMANSLQPYGPNGACQAPLSVGFSRQEYWSGLPCPPPGDLPNPGTEPASHVSCIGKWVLYH